jgi:hypothetical protein
MKKDNTSIYYKDWTTKYLKSEARSLHELIYGEICGGHSVRDIRMYDGILDELHNRGVEISSQLEFN